MNKLFTVLTVAASLLVSAAASAIEVTEVVTKANHAAYYQGTDGKARVQMTIVDAQGRERSRDFTILRLDVEDDSDGAQKMYVYFNRPADVNKTAFMVWKQLQGDDDRWLYLPALDLVKRIAASDERTSFVGSHFFYEDVSGRVPTEDNHVLVDETANYYVVESTPKNPSLVEFASYKNWIHRESFLPVRTEFYDASGQAYRSYDALKVDTIGGYQTVTESRMSDTRLGGHTIMGYSDVEYDLGLDEDLFTERYLRNPPRRYLR
jgi:hypothetical protein